MVGDPLRGGGGEWVGPGRIPPYRIFKGSLDGGTADHPPPYSKLVGGGGALEFPAPILSIFLPDQLLFKMYTAFAVYLDGIL